MSLVEQSLKRPVTTSMVFIALVVLGVLAALRLPLEFMPEFDVPFLFVQIPYAGSTPAEIERTITRPAEATLATMSGVKRIESNSRADAAEIFIEFDWSKRIGVAAVEARERIEAIRAELPSDVQRFFVFKFSTSDQAVLSLRIASNRDLTNAYDLLERKLKRPLERIPGVARVDLQGVQRPEVRIDLLADRITAHGIDIAELNQRLRDSSFSTSAGLITEGALRFRVQPLGELTSIEAMQALVINDQGLRLGDIANISLQPARMNYGRHLEMKPAIAVEIFKERGANLVQVGRAALAEVQRIGRDPEMQGINIFFIQDQAEGVTSSLKELAEAGLVGLLFSVLVLFAFLRHWASTLMVSLAIPVSFAITLGMMYFFGLSLNILSMMGLLLGVGMVLDNAVVAVESIYQQREKWPHQPARCAVVGTRNITIAISAGTLSSVVVFLPNIFGEQNFISQSLANIAIAISISLLASWLVAVTLIPMLSAHMEAPDKGLHLGWIARFRLRYADFIGWTLRHRGRTLLATLALLLVSLLPMSLTKQDMFPTGETRDLQLRYELNGAYQLSELERAVTQVEEYLNAHRKELEIRSLYSYFDEQGNVITMLLLTDSDVAIRSSEVIMEDVRKGLPKLAISTPNFGEGRRSGASGGLTISLLGESSTVLTELLPSVRQVLANVPGVRDVKAAAAGSADKEVQVRVDRERALRYGFSAAQVAQFISVAMRGAPLREFEHKGEEIPVWLRFQGADTQGLDDLRDLRIKSPLGERVPLLSLVSVSTADSPTIIHRSNRQTGAQVQLNLAKDVTEGEVRERIQKALDGLQLPPGYRWTFGQGFDESNEALAQMGFNTLIALLMIFIVMAAVFESLLYPVAILTSILFSVFGIYWLFWLTGTTFSLMAWIGALILMGVVVNNGIVMVEHINQLRAQGMGRDAALVQGSRDRLRPVLMTMATTICGMLPLCLGNTQVGGDGPPYYPMARAIVGGLIFSTLITLAVLPSIYAVFDDWRSRSARFLGRAAGVQSN